MRGLRAALLGAALLALALPLRAERALVFAAASLQEVMNAAVSAFHAQSEHRIGVSYAGSNALARQVENGAPADLFVSADAEWVDFLQQRNLVAAGSRRELASNELVLVAPAASTLGTKLRPGVDLAGALGSGRLAMANPDAVPAGKYAKSALRGLRAWAPVESRIAGADNVRAALLLVARGEAPLGIVYRTDAMVEPRVKVLDAFPRTLHPPVTYTLVRLASSRSGAATAFADFLAAPEGRALFARHGFRSP